MISLRGPKLKIFAGILAVISLVGGVYITFFESRGFAKTTGTIIDITEESDFDGETKYWPVVEYTVDGTTYTTQLNASSGLDKVGKTITILYDPNDPAVAHGNNLLGIYFIVVGAGILVFIAVITVRGKKKQQQTQELRETANQMGYAPSVQGEERELYFLTDLGTTKYGHRIEDQNRHVLYEAKMKKFSLTSAHQFDFIDHEHGTTVPHMVGHEEESNWNMILIDNHYTFELDGVDVWKHLKQSGISVDTNFTAGETTVVGKNYRILRDGKEIAHAVQTSQYPHEEDATQHKVAGAIPIQGFFRLWTREQNLDLLFVTLMAFARSGASDDRGGNYGALFGMLKKIGKNK